MKQMLRNIFFRCGPGFRLDTVSGPAAPGCYGHRAENGWTGPGKGAAGLQRDIFTSEHDAFRDMVRAFIARNITPYHEQWERDRVVSREVWRQAGRAGLLGIEIDEKYGGGGNPDYTYYLIMNEELARAGAHGPGFSVHNDIVGQYLVRLVTPEQAQRWLPGYCSGELITAIAMSEPGAGSDLQGIRTTAVRDGDDWILNGQKTFISNGQLCDLVIVFARTDPDAGHLGYSLLWSSAAWPASSAAATWRRSACMRRTPPSCSSATSGCPRPTCWANPAPGSLPSCRTCPASGSRSASPRWRARRRVFATTLDYCRQRQAFGRPIGSFQHNRFQLAEMATELAVARAFTDRAVTEHVAGRLSTEDAAMVKWWDTELCNRVVDRCVQLYGGYGYMREYPVARAFADGRVQSIFGGTTEIMKEIIGRGLGV